ncbi:hypothetical protein [Nocardia sp. NBC_00403]|uniref:hypothetical protein n=1 Tax=Nocardia sp. NBC_00403 TaxID=2975990 RepID=UPI002E1B8C5D
MRNLPFRSCDANRVWLALVTLALDLTAWMQTLALTNLPARRWARKSYGCGCSRSPPAWPDTTAASTTIERASPCLWNPAARLTAIIRYVLDSHPPTALN